MVKRNSIEEINKIFCRLAELKNKELKESEKMEKNVLVNDIVMKYQPLVIKIAQKYRNSPFYEDLLQEGMIALMRQVEIFDQRKSFDFSAYAKKRVMVEMRRYSDKNSDACEYLDAFKQDDEVAELESNPEYQFNKKEVINIVNGLPEKLKNVISLRFGLHNAPDLTLNEIGDELGITRERVRQIQNQALGILKKKFKENNLTDINTI